MCEFRVLVINPGSTSTKVAVYEDEREVFLKTISYQSLEINKFDKLIDQMDMRKKDVLEAIEQSSISFSDINGIVGRGGILSPLKSGTYSINDKMIDDLKTAKFGEHASNLGAIIASEFSTMLKLPAFIVDPVVVDEMDDIARISGLPSIQRKSIFHALNQKATARRACNELKKPYDECGIVVAHLGGGISVGVHKNGKVVDVNNALYGDGPFSPERSGSLPVCDLINLCFSGTYSFEGMMSELVGKGGIVSYLGTNDLREVKRIILEDSERSKMAQLVYDSLVYQVGKEIGGASTVLSGILDGIILTGGMANDCEFIEKLKGMIGYLGKIFVYPGEMEMQALAAGGIKALKNEVDVLEY